MPNPNILTLPRITSDERDAAEILIKEGSVDQTTAQQLIGGGETEIFVDNLLEPVAGLGVTSVRDALGAHEEVNNLRDANDLQPQPYEKGTRA